MHSTKHATLWGTTYNKIQGSANLYEQLVYNLEQCNVLEEWEDSHLNAWHV